jgi:hypothetical protein
VPGPLWATRTQIRRLVKKETWRRAASVCNPADIRANRFRSLTIAPSERDSPRDQLVVSLFLLTVFGLLLGAGIKGRMVKAGLNTSLLWHTGRKWWQVSARSLSIEPVMTSRSIENITCLYVTQAWIPGRFDDIDVGLRTRPSRARRDYVAVSDSGGEHSQRGG